jgi:hypothetical protein
MARKPKASPKPSPEMGRENTMSETIRETVARWIREEDDAARKENHHDS